MGNQVLTADSALLQNFLADMREGAKVFVGARAARQEPWPLVNSYLERARASRNEGAGAAAAGGGGGRPSNPTVDPNNPVGLTIPSRR
jgi:hypothetical protein